MPPKRRRTESAADSEPSQDEVEAAPPPERCEELWLDDGSIVLQAENVQFKVHRSVYVLKALYGEQDYVNTDAVLTLSAIAAMIRLGRKYEINHLKEEGLRRLKRQFPVTLDDYDVLDPFAYSHVSFKDSPEDASTEHEKVFAFINIAHECGIQSILPTLYLESTRCSLESLLYDSEDLRIPYSAHRSCILGREKLLFSWMERPHSVVVADNCLTRSVCKAGSRVLGNALRMPPDELGAIMFPWAAFIGTWPAVEEASKILCQACMEGVKKAHDAERQKLWDALPSFFKLPDWGNLKDFET
ncbi:hypothetical protein NMY22_g9227 [Coprinellus aureogranulatus]|nr:hypothetical protein NMY22_g9227 [Coprinellus aureogranulatus]